MNRKQKSKNWSLNDFFPEPPRDPGAWKWVWSNDIRFPIRSHRRLIGKFVVFLKKIVAPIARFAQTDYLDRQKVFNLIVVEYLEKIRFLEKKVDSLEKHRQDVDTLLYKGMHEIMKHTDGLCALLDSKLNEYRKEVDELLALLNYRIVSVENGASGGNRTKDDTKKVLDSWKYRKLEDRFRGTEEEIKDRLSIYLGYLKGREPVLDIACGRGEFLELLTKAGIECRGVDVSPAMVKVCKDKGLDVEEKDVFSYLSSLDPNSVGAITAFHFVEHLNPEQFLNLISFVWKVLKKGGVFIIETPNPLSLKVAATNFWLDPTHVRPLHPELAKVLLSYAGFKDSEVLFLHQFSTSESLPEIKLQTCLSSDMEELVYSLNLLRDKLNDLLFGYQDYSIIGYKN